MVKSGIYRNIIQRLFSTGQAEGNIIYFHSGQYTDLPLGSANFVLASNGTDPVYVANLPSNLNFTGQANGDIIYYNGSWQVLHKGSNGQFLTLTAGLPAWANNPVAPANPQEGDLIYYTSGTWTRFPVGTNNQYIKSNGTDPTFYSRTSADVTTELGYTPTNPANYDTANYPPTLDGSAKVKASELGNAGQATISVAGFSDTLEHFAIVGLF